jgi:hypothetical protein
MKYFPLFQTPSIPLGRGFEKGKYQQVQSKIEDYILSLKIVVQLNGSITFTAS